VADADTDEDPSVPSTHVERPTTGERSTTGAAVEPTFVARPSTGEPVRRSMPSVPQLGRRYELRVEIARGGMGRVVEALDTVLGRTVAIKEVIGTDDELIARFERETRITARLEHPSIVPVHDAGRNANGAPFYVMRKVSGKPLDQLVREAGTLNDRLALLPHMLAAANAIAHAHERGVIHRDLKPTNILVGKLGETVVIDWGLAKVLDEPDDVSDHASGPPVNLQHDSDSLPRVQDDGALRTRIGSIVGTPGFMSPEQLRGLPVDARADVYALGASLYYLLARRVPHAAKTGDEMIDLALKGPPTPLRELAPGVPAELATIVDHALAPGDDERYHTARGFAEDLDRFLKGQLVASHRYSRRERYARWLKRHRLSVTIATVALLTLAIGGYISIARTIRERDRADRALVITREQNEQLQLSHALTLVPTHPTGAVALVRHLAAKHWETARAVAMAARARGVAYGLPASQFTRSLEMSADGIRVLSAGNDGIVRIHDLRARQSRVVAKLGGDAFATWVDNERLIVAWTGNRIAVIPVTGGTLREVALASEPKMLRGTGSTVVWCDKQGAVWSMPLATLEPQRVPTNDDPVDHLETHGERFALAGRDSLWLFEPGQGAARIAIAGHARELAYSPTGELAAILDDFKSLYVIELDATGKVIAQTDYPGAYAIAWQAGQLWVGSERGLGTRTSIEIQVRGGVHQLLAGPGEALVARTRQSAFTLYDEKIIAEIPPTYAIHDLATGRNSGFVAAGSDYVVLVWALDNFRPQTVPLPAAANTMYADADQMIAVHDNASATWIELATLARTPIDLPGPIASFVFAPDGSSALAITRGHSAVLYRRGVPGSQMIGTAVTAAAFASPTQIVIGTETGHVRVIDLSGATVRDLIKSDTEVQAIAFAGEWIAAHFRDGQLARMKLDGSVRASLPADGKLHWFELFASGELAYTDFSELRVWHPDGAMTPYPGLPTPVSAVEAIGPSSFIVYTGGDSAHLVELGPARRTSAAYPPGTRMEWLRLEGDHGVYLSPDGALHETSPRTGVSWGVSTPRRERFIGPALSKDRSHLYVLAGDRLLVWSHELPRDAAATAALYDSLTNAKPIASADAAIAAPTPTLRLSW
jgi:serine/threonine protein kinase